MSLLLFVFALGLGAVAIRLVIHAAVLPRVRLSTHLRQIQGYGWERAVAAGNVSAREQLNTAITNLARGIGGWALERFPGLPALKRGELTAAGYYEVTPDVVHGFRVIAGAGMFLLILLLMLAGGSLSFVTLLITCALGVAGFMLPAVVIRSKGAKRLQEIDRTLPDLIDLLIATVEAGMAIGASLSLVAPRFKGALGDELRLTIKQQSLGISNEQALNDMVERCDTPTIRSFVRTVTRGESMGVSIGPILRELAVDARRRRRQTAEEKMRKAPVKLLFPLMLLIFPALMIELLFPAIYLLAHNL
jgi:Flp pilus assembly protein TadB